MLVLAGAGPAGARTVDARVSAAFVMRGRIVTAVRVAGEHRGQRITRAWTFASGACLSNICRHLVLTRQRSANQFDHLVLSRVGPGRYTGHGLFYAGLECRGAIYPEGQKVPYRVTVAVTRTRSVEGVRFATALRATYTNARRVDRTICPTGPSHDAATYTGRASPAPSPPTAAFSATIVPGTESVAFTSTSAVGGDQSPITAYAWQFGDPGTPAADTAATPQASHMYAAPGTYRVTLKVTDANGLTASQTQSVVVPPPPG